MHNGKILFLVFIKGPFLLDLNSTEMVEYKKNKKPFTIFQNLNLLNTTTMNTRYGIVDRMLELFLEIFNFINIKELK